MNATTMARTIALRGLTARLIARARPLSTAAEPRATATLHFTQTLLIVPDGSGPTGEPNKPHEKVSLRVAVSELHLTDAQLERLALVAGPRFDASTGMLKLVGRVHETAEENRAVVRAQLRLLIDDALSHAPDAAPPPADGPAGATREAGSAIVDAVGAEGAPSSARDGHPVAPAKYAAPHAEPESEPAARDRAASPPAPGAATGVPVGGTAARVEAALHDAMKAKQTDRLSALRSIRAAFQLEQTRAGAGGKLHEAGCIAALRQLLKQRHEAIEAFAGSDERQAQVRARARARRAAADEPARGEARAPS